MSTPIEEKIDQKLKVRGLSRGSEEPGLRRDILLRLFVSLTLSLSLFPLSLPRALVVRRSSVINNASALALSRILGMQHACLIPVGEAPLAMRRRCAAGYSWMSPPCIRRIEHLVSRAK